MNAFKLAISPTEIVYELLRIETKEFKFKYIIKLSSLEINF
jgi:hypothetical protein